MKTIVCVENKENIFEFTDGQKKLRLEDVAMLDKNKIILGLIENKNFNINVFEPFSDLVKDFLNDFSNRIKKQKETYSYPNLIYLSMWASKKSVKKLEKKFKSNQIRLGRGLIFHICPSNVPTNLIDSLISKGVPSKQIIMTGHSCGGVVNNDVNVKISR